MQLYSLEVQCTCTAQFWQISTNWLTGLVSSASRSPSRKWASPQCSLCSPSFSWGFFLFPCCWHSPTSVLAAHEIISNQHPGCWETTMYCKVSVFMAQQSQLFRSGSWDTACALRLCRHKGIPSSHSLCACATELKRIMNCAGLQLDLNQDFLTRIIRLQGKSREFSFSEWFTAHPSLSAIP